MKQTGRTVLGKVVSIWRYPNKVHDRRGAEFFIFNRTRTSRDRTYAILDLSTGRVASAKNLSKWGRLFDFHSMFMEHPIAEVHKDKLPVVRITLPDGTIFGPIKITLITYYQRHGIEMLS